MHIIIPNIRIEAGAHCLFATLKNMLAAGYGLQLSETEFYFFSDALNVEHHYEAKPFWIGRSEEDMMRKFAEHSPIELEYSFSYAGEEERSTLPAQMEETLASGRLVMLFVHSRALDYHNLRGADHYGSYPNRTHVLFVYGMNREQDLAYVGDACYPDTGGSPRAYQGTVPLSRLIDNVYGTAALGPLRACWSSNPQQTAHAQRRKQAFMSMVGRRLDRFLEGGTTSEGAMQGMLAYRSLADGLQRLAEQDDDTFMFRCKEAYDCLRTGSLLHQWHYLQQLVQQFSPYFSSGSAYWLEKLGEERLIWQKQLNSMYQAGVRKQQSVWLSLLAHTGRLLERQEAILYHLAEELKIRA